MYNQISSEILENTKHACMDAGQYNDPNESGLPVTRHGNPKATIEHAKVDSYYPKTKQLPQSHLVVKAEAEAKSENKSDSYLGISKQMYPLASISQREGKITPTKTEL
jgi:hypothetical protein